MSIPPEPGSQERSAVDLAVERSRVRAAIADCTRCPLGRRHHDIPGFEFRPVPFRGRAPARVMVIGEAPGPTDARRGSAFVGSVGKLLGQMMADVGLHFDDFFYAHAVSCYPIVPRPAAEHVAACRIHLAPQVQLCDPEIVVTLGAVALASVGFKAKLATVHGRLFKAPAGPFIDRWILPTFHPLVAFQDTGKGTQIRADLSTIRRILSGSITPEAASGARVGRGGKVLVS